MWFSKQGRFGFGLRFDDFPNDAGGWRPWWLWWLSSRSCSWLCCVTWRGGQAACVWLLSGPLIGFASGTAGGSGKAVLRRAAVLRVVDRKNVFALIGASGAMVSA
ncbi:hypothetical protein [Thalassobacterium sedimentorum]|uniref:hypothetical protein n=1 Tax=Thalassobacterium sedimentorum TaxID=3041258 RepID=UPI0028125A7F|nr:hypothetical protein [Coraliomargarita sp. SDUM461004]